MDIQNQIKRTLSQPECLAYVSGLLEGEEYLSRTDVAVKVCEEFGFQDPRGQHQLGGCLKALRELEGKGWFQLRAPQIEKGGTRSRRLLEPVAEPQGVPAEVGAIVGLELVRVEQEDQMRIWNELMIREHPQGAGPLVGLQIRYLVHSAHGWADWGLPRRPLNWRIETAGSAGMISSGGAVGSHRMSRPVPDQKFCGML